PVVRFGHDWVLDTGLRQFEAGPFLSAARRSADGGVTHNWAGLVSRPKLMAPSNSIVPGATSACCPATRAATNTLCRGLSSKIAAPPALVYIKSIACAAAATPDVADSRTLHRSSTVLVSPAATVAHAWPTASSINAREERSAASAAATSAWTGARSASGR